MAVVFEFVLFLNAQRRKRLYTWYGNRSIIKTENPISYLVDPFFGQIVETPLKTCKEEVQVKYVWYFVSSLIEIIQ